MPRTFLITAILAFPCLSASADDWSASQIENLPKSETAVPLFNGTLVADWSDPKPELCGTGPIGLQLHSNKVPQEVHFRGLILTVNPEGTLVTVAK
ncbi:MAG: hypothetical protein CMJ48_08690 [Planctomycetaceae bacterium]|nr:hypothetical protein [Planctomycetaceae bacterium]